MLYGIALADGKVPPPEAKLYDQFPELCRPGEPAWPRPHHGRPRPQHGDGHRVGRDSRCHTPIRATARSRWKQRPIAIATYSRAGRRTTRREVDLQRRRHGTAGLPDHPRHRREAAGLRATGAVRPDGCRTDRMVARQRRRDARRLGAAPAPDRSPERRPDGAGERRLAGPPDRAGEVAGAVDHARRRHRRSLRLRLALVSPDAAGGGARDDQRGGVGRPAAVHHAGARPRRGDELRQLLEAGHGPAPRRRHADA